MANVKVADGQIATVVTYLEMMERPESFDPIDSPLTVQRWNEPNVPEYHAIFKAVGEHWLWFSRLAMNPQMLLKTLRDPNVEIYFICDKNGERVGFLELDFREPDECEIGFLGLVPELAGKGHGRWLMNEVLHHAWKDNIERVWLHTCTLDSPRALPFYQMSGFVPYKSEVETFRDPRLTGHLPANAAPQIPIIS